MTEDAALAARPGEFFSWTELRAVDAPPEVRRALWWLCHAVLDPLRIALARRVRVTSAWRPDAVNDQTPDAAKTSQHERGEAADVKVRGYTAEALARYIVGMNLPFDQLIWYAPTRRSTNPDGSFHYTPAGQVHVSHTLRRAQRRQTLHAPAEGGYVKWAA